jgi:hypothetical protein
VPRVSARRLDESKIDLLLSALRQICDLRIAAQYVDDTSAYRRVTTRSAAPPLFL